MSSSIETISTDKWFADGMNGDVLLCDPFTGRPLVAGGLEQPPAAFAEDNDLGAGYGVWRGSRYMAGQAIDVGILLTEPSDKQGLGSRRELRDNMSQFSAVGYANKRGLVREAQIKGVAATVGAVTLSGELVPDDTYLSMLYDVAAENNTLLFSFDPEQDMLSGQPLGRTAVGLQKVEDTLRTEMMALDDPTEPDGSHVAMDITYCNTLQWHGVGRSGQELAKIQSEAGVFPPAVLLIVPAEQHHLARKMQMAAQANVEAVFARPEFARIPEATAYPLAMEAGFIPGSVLRQ